MKHLLSKRWRVVLFIFIPLLVSFACLSDDSPTGDPTSEAATVQTDVVFGSGDFNLEDPKAGLADLSSYNATLKLAFEGTRDGQPSQWSKTYLMLTTKEPVARQLTLKNAGDISNLDAVFMAEMNGTAYEQRGENACNAIVINSENSLAEQLEPASFLTFVIGADEVGSETVNDVAANHYTFDQRAFGLTEDFAQSTGEMWVATDGGYILKYLLTTKGNADYFGEGIEGTLTLDYQLTDINQPVLFTLPADCPAGMVDAPLLPDAATVVNMPSILTYDTSTGLTEVAAFYQEQIPSLGWTLVGEPTITETNAVIDFSQDNQTMTIIITTDGSVTTVNILLGKAQEK